MAHCQIVESNLELFGFYNVVTLLIDLILISNQLHDKWKTFCKKCPEKNAF